MKKEFIESQIREKSLKEKRTINKHSFNSFYKKQRNFKKKEKGRKLLRYLINLYNGIIPTSVHPYSFLKRLRGS